MKLTPEIKETMLEVLWCELGTRDSAKAVELIEAVLAALPKPEIKEIALRIEADTCGNISKAEAEFVIEAFLAALPKPEPVATKIETQQFDCFHVSYGDHQKLKALPIGTKLYTSPPATSELEAQNAALLVAIEAKNAALRKAKSMIAGMTAEDCPDTAYIPVIEALALPPSAELLEARDRRVIQDFVSKFKRYVGGDGEFWLHELEDFYETGK